MKHTAYLFKRMEPFGTQIKLRSKSDFVLMHYKQILFLFQMELYNVRQVLMFLKLFFFSWKTPPIMSSGQRFYHLFLNINGN